MDNLTIGLFDVISYLNDKGVPFSTEGKHVTSGWIGLSCIFCDDTSDHLGVNLTSNYLSCWRCGIKGSVAKLVKEIEHSRSFSEVLYIMEKYQDISRLSLIKDDAEFTPKLKIQIPTIFSKAVWPNVPNILKTFLFNRGFDPEKTCRNKELYYGGIVGKFKHRLIFPVTLRGKLVSWVGRDLSSRSSVPYLNLEEEKSVLPVKETLYGFDEAPPGRNIVVVEGIIDQWKLGPGSVATFGTQWTMSQVKLLRELNPNKIFILFDSEETAQKSAVKLSKQIWFCDSEVFYLDRVKDPGELTTEQGQKIMKDIQRI